SNNYLLDGTDMNDGYRNDPAINEAGVFGTPATILPIDAVAEVNVISNFQPEYGRNSGAVVNIVTKSGTNTIHGSAAEYFRNSALDARNFFNPSSQPKAPFHNNQYGASLGGPIVKDKTFFYFDYEGQQEPVGVVTVAKVPTGTAADGSLGPNDATNTVIQGLLARHPWPAPNLSNPNPGLVSPDGVASVVSPSFNKLTSFIADQSFHPSSISLCAAPSTALCNGGAFDSGLPIILLSSTSLVNPTSSVSVAQLGATSSLPRHRVDSNNQILDNFSWKLNKHD